MGQEASRTGDGGLSVSCHPQYLGFRSPSTWHQAVRPSVYLSAPFPSFLGLLHPVLHWLSLKAIILLLKLSLIAILLARRLSLQGYYAGLSTSPAIHIYPVGTVAPEVWGLNAFTLKVFTHHWPTHLLPIWEQVSSQVLPPSGSLP